MVTNNTLIWKTKETFKTQWFLFKSRFVLSRHTPWFRTLQTRTYTSLIALVLGFCLSFIILGAFGVNFATFYRLTFKFAFGMFHATTLILTSIFIFGALAVGIAFRGSFFNIGVAGQMIMAGGLSNLVFIAFTNYTHGARYLSATANPALVMVLGFIVAAAAGCCFAGFAGVLKAYLKINEVVSTILLNYFAFYFTKWIFFSHAKYWDPNVGGSITYSHQFSYQIGSNVYLVPLLIAFLLAGILFFVVYFTVFGFKMSAVYKNKTVAWSNGIDYRLVILKVSCLSGMLAGIMGLFFYNKLFSGQILYGQDALPPEAFTVIAIALIVYNDPLLILVSALLYGALQEGFKIAVYSPGVKLSPRFDALMFGILIYFIAINRLFLGLQPWHWGYRYYILWFKTPDYHAKKHALRQEIMALNRKIRSYKKLQQAAWQSTEVSVGSWWHKLTQPWHQLQHEYYAGLYQAWSQHSQNQIAISQIYESQARIQSLKRSFRYQKQKWCSCYLQTGLVGLHKEYRHQRRKLTGVYFDNHRQLQEHFVGAKYKLQHPAVTSHGPHNKDDIRSKIKHLHHQLIREQISNRCAYYKVLQQAHYDYYKRKQEVISQNVQSQT